MLTCFKIWLLNRPSKPDKVRMAHRWAAVQPACLPWNPQFLGTGAKVHRR
jgi:hypothetical protein